MERFEDRVAVVTGAASGIGRGIAIRCAEEKMRVVVADVELPALEETEQAIRALGAEVLSVRTDVARREEVEALARATLDRFGAVHLVVNNAGVGGGGRVAWEATPEDWEWTLGVNLWGVIHGVSIFVPIMLAQGSEGHVVNTASIEGLWTRPGNAPYQVSKHGVVALTEALHHDLAIEGAPIGASVLCPAAVDTRIIDSWRNRPEHLRNPPPENPPEITPEMQERMQRFREGFKQGMTPAECADHVFRAVRQGNLHILTHPQHKHFLEERVNAILEDRNPDVDTLPFRGNRAEQDDNE